MGFNSGFKGLIKICLSVVCFIDRLTKHAKKKKTQQSRELSLKLVDFVDREIHDSG